MIRTKRGILVRGTFAGDSKVACSRCLIPLECPLVIELQEEFLPTIDVSTGIPLPLDEDPATFAIDDHHVLDLTEALRQYGLLAIPMKPLCKPDCAGLCPQCGANLNQGKCLCTPNISPTAPSESLADLLEQES
ncbi:MAG: DUF177 domain-containing protein [Chloroflexi bacterium]|nr:DUF177 domain-containing protein [Chloroflexota bacterium]